MKVINTTQYDDTITLSELKNGFWLYDKTRGMNLSMRAESADMAFFESIKYYQKRLLSVEDELKKLQSKVDNFIAGVCPDKE